MNSIRKPELLAPASNLDKLKVAIDFGADAVYIGGEEYSLRANAENFSIDKIKEACNYAHERNKKVYVSVNILFHDADLYGLEEYLINLYNSGVDGIMVADPFVIDIVKERVPNLNIFISTQQSSMNLETVKFFESEGVKRVVLGREVNRDDMKYIVHNTNMEIEVFIHGSMCMSYSGRCTLSNHMVGRDANRGGCIGICRWEWPLLDRENNIVDSNIDYSMSAKDLSMIKYIPELIDMGVASFKIEGRMRSDYYIATVVNLYRRLIDEYVNNPDNFNISEFYYNEEKKCANRESTVQNYDKYPTFEEQYYHTSNNPSRQTFVGVVTAIEGEYAIVEERNVFSLGDTLEVLSPNSDVFEFRVTEILDEDNNKIESARKPTEKVKVKMDREVNIGDMFRQKDK